MRFSIFDFHFPFFQVKCFFELVEVEAPVCHEVTVKKCIVIIKIITVIITITVYLQKVPVEECIDALQETPFLVDTEQCEDVPKLVCTEVSSPSDDVFIPSFLQHVCTKVFTPNDAFIPYFSRDQKVINLSDQIEEQVPIQVCKTIDKQRTPIVIGKGR